MDARTVIAGGGSQGLSIVREVGNRVLGAPALVANLAGRTERKRLRVAAVVLSASEAGDAGRGRPLASEDRLRAELHVADELFRRQANTELFWDDWPRIRTIEDPAPRAALDVDCGSRSWLQDLGAAGVWFREHQRGLASRTRGATGYGEPVTVFVVRDIAGKAGCSLGPLSDYVTVDRVRGRLIAHELGHACGLWHVADAGNLMHHTADSETMTRAQQAIFRNSRHVSLR